MVEVSCRVGAALLLLVSGEIEERSDHGWDSLWGEESVLVFTELSRADLLEWRPPRTAQE